MKPGNRAIFCPVYLAIHCLLAKGRKIVDSTSRGTYQIVSRVRMNWSVIVLMPVAFVLLNGLLVFVLITLSTW